MVRGVTREQLHGYIYTGNSGLAHNGVHFVCNFAFIVKWFQNTLQRKFCPDFPAFSSLFSYQLKRTTNFKFINQGKVCFWVPFYVFICFLSFFFFFLLTALKLSAAQSMTGFQILWLKFYSIIYVKFD